MPPKHPPKHPPKYPQTPPKHPPNHPRTLAAVNSPPLLLKFLFKRLLKDYIGIYSLYCQDQQSLLLGLIVSTVRIRKLQRQNCIIPNFSQNLAQNLVKNLAKNPGGDRLITGGKATSRRNTKEFKLTMHLPIQEIRVLLYILIYFQ